MKRCIYYLLLCLAGALVFIHIAGCKKSGSIVGTWRLESESYLYSVTNQYIFDTSFNTSPPTTVTFTASGSVSSSARVYPLPVRGTYTLSNGRINYYDSVYMTTGSVSYEVVRTKTLCVTYNDTINPPTPPIQYLQKTYYFSR